MPLANHLFQAGDELGESGAVLESHQTLAESSKIVADDGGAQRVSNACGELVTKLLHLRKLRLVALLHLEFQRCQRCTQYRLCPGSRLCRVATRHAEQTVSR